MISRAVHHTGVQPISAAVGFFYNVRRPPACGIGGICGIAARSGRRTRLLGRSALIVQPFARTHSDKIIVAGLVIERSAQEHPRLHAVIGDMNGVPVSRSTPHGAHDRLGLVRPAGGKNIIDRSSVRALRFNEGRIVRVSQHTLAVDLGKIGIAPRILIPRVGNVSGNNLHGPLFAASLVYNRTRRYRREYTVCVGRDRRGVAHFDSRRIIGSHNLGSLDLNLRDRLVKISPAEVIVTNTIIPRLSAFVRTRRKRGKRKQRPEQKRNRLASLLHKIPPGNVFFIVAQIPIVCKSSCRFFTHVLKV